MNVIYTLSHKSYPV